MNYYATVMQILKSFVTILIFAKFNQKIVIVLLQFDTHTHTHTKLYNLLL